MLEDYVGEDGVARRRARLYRPPPARQHGQPTICGARSRQAAGRAGHRDRPRFHAAARRAADPRRERATASAARPRCRSARASSAATIRDGQPLSLARAGDRLGRRRASCAPWSRAAQAQADRARLRPAGRQLRPGRLLPDALRAGAARPPHPRIIARLRPLDQIGLLADNWALGLAGYQSPAAALDMVEAAPAERATAGCWSRIADIYRPDRRHVRGRPRAPGDGRPLSPSAKLGPALRRLGWSAARRASRPTTRCCAAS